MNSFPVQLLAADERCSSTIIRPASRAGSFSCVCLAFVIKCSFKLGNTFSLKARLAEGRRSMILKTFWRMSDASSLSFISSSRAGSTFFSMTDLGNEGNTLLRPRMNEAFSLGVLAGKPSRKRMVETRMLSKYSLDWNSLAVIRCAGRRVMSRGRTELERSLGIGRFERKLLPAEGTVADEAKSRL